MRYEPWQSFDDKVASLFQTDPLVPGLYFDAFRRKSPLEPEMRLMLAVLEDAIICLRKNIRAKNLKGKTLFREAEDWILDRGSDSLFSFDNVCEVLSLDPQHLRRGLMGAKEKWLAESLQGAAQATHRTTKRIRRRKKYRDAA